MRTHTCKTDIITDMQNWPFVLKANRKIDEEMKVRSLEKQNKRSISFYGRKILVWLSMQQTNFCGLALTKKLQRCRLHGDIQKPRTHFEHMLFVAKKSRQPIGYNVIFLPSTICAYWCILWINNKALECTRCEEKRRYIFVQTCDGICTC